MGVFRLRVSDAGVVVTRDPCSHRHQCDEMMSPKYNDRCGRVRGAKFFTHGVNRCSSARGPVGVGDTGVMARRAHCSGEKGVGMRMRDVMWRISGTETEANTQK